MIWRNKSPKRILYTVCFAALCLIDCVRHTLGEEWWGPLVNCGGLLLLLITLTACKRKELKRIFNYVWTALVLLVAAGAALFGDLHIFGVYKWTLVTALLNVWLIGLLAYRTVYRIFVAKALKLHLNVGSVLWIVMTVLMTLSPFRAVWPLWFFCIFSLFYLTKFTEQDFVDLREGMIDGIILGFFILQIYAYGYRPYDEVRYKGAFANCIMAAMHYMVTYTAVLLKIRLLVQRKASKFWKAFYFIGAAGLLGFQLLTMTRTAWVATAVITILYAIFVIRKEWKAGWGRIIGYAAMLGVSTVVLFPVVYATVRWLPPLRHHPIWYAGEWSESKVQSSDDPTSEKYISFEEVLEELLGRVGISVSWNDPLVLEAKAVDTAVSGAAEAEVQTTDDDMAVSVDESVAEAAEIASDANEIVSDGTTYRVISIGDTGSKAATSMRTRFAYYKAYLQDLNWIGHTDKEGHYYVAENGDFVWHSQNVWIQLLYCFGIPAGVLFIILSIMMLIRQFGYAIRARRITSLVPLLITVAYAVFGLTEVVWLAGQFLLFAVFLVQHPQFTAIPGRTDAEIAAKPEKAGV